MFKKLFALLFVATLLSSCAGYKLGYQKPSELVSVSNIYVPLFENKTQEQRLATLATNSMVDALTRDGTYKITPKETADATLIATIDEIKYTSRRSSRFDTLRASDLNVEIYIDWKLVDAQNLELTSGSHVGYSYFTVGANQQLSRNNAFPDAASDAAENITQRLANGF